MNQEKPPYTLTKSQAKNPHRRVPGKTGSPSILELSFRSGNRQEIDFWKNTGVLQEALEGRARSRIDYTVSLMDQFTYHISRNFLGRESFLEDDMEILETLWEAGGRNHKDRFASWMANTISHPFSERFIDLGICPWKKIDSTPWIKPGNPKKKDANDVISHANAIETALYQLERVHSYITSDDLGMLANHQDSVNLVGKINKMILAGGHKTSDLSSCLGKVVAGGMTTGTSSYGTDWAAWRDRLLEMGAIPTTSYGGAISQIIKSSPHRPISSWEMDRKYNRYIKLSRGGSEEGGGIDSLQTYKEFESSFLQTRALTWMKTARAWLDVFDKKTSGQNLPSDKEDGHVTDNTLNGISNLLDVPGGDVIIKGISRLITNQGKRLPWSEREQSPYIRTYIDPDLVLNSQQRRSLRKLKSIKNLLNDQSINSKYGVSGRWRGGIVLGYLDSSALEKGGLDIEAGMVVASDKDILRKYRFGGLSTVFSRMTPPTKDELNVLLDIAGPDVLDLGKIKFSGDDEKGWISSFMYNLPLSWDISKTAKKRRTEILDVLAQRGVISWLLGRGEMLTGKPLESHGQTDTVAYSETAAFSADVMTSLWFGRWASEDALLAELKSSISRNADNCPGCLEYVSRLEAAYRLTNPPFGEHNLDELVPDLSISQIVMRSSDPKDFVSFLGKIAHDRMLAINGDDHSRANSALRATRQAIAVGWEPESKMELVDLISNKTLLMKTPLSQVNQHIIVDILDALKIIPEDGLGNLSRSLMHAKHNEVGSSQWGEIIFIAIERGCKIDLSKLPDPQDKPGGLIDYIQKAIVRRKLGEQARELRGLGDDLPDAEKIRAKRPMI